MTHQLQKRIRASTGARDGSLVSQRVGVGPALAAAAEDHRKMIEVEPLTRFLFPRGDELEVSQPRAEFVRRPAQAALLIGPDLLAECRIAPNVHFSQAPDGPGMVTMVREEPAVIHIVCPAAESVKGGSIPLVEIGTVSAH